MAASDSAFKAVFEGQFGNRMQAAGVCIQPFVHMKIQLQAVLTGQIKHPLQFFGHVVIAVDKRTQQRCLALAAVTALMDLRHRCRNLLRHGRCCRVNCVRAQNIQRRKRNTLQHDAAPPGITQVLERSQRTRRLGVWPVQVGAHGARAAVVGLPQRAGHALLNRFSRPAVAVRRHQPDGLEQISVCGTHLVHNIGFVNMHVQVGQGGNKDARCGAVSGIAGGCARRWKRGTDGGDNALFNAHIETVSV